MCAIPKWPTFKGGDKAWEEYLSANVEAAKTDVKVYRQFLAIGDGDQDEDDIESGLPPEAKALRAGRVRDQLNFRVLCSAEGAPVKMHPDQPDWHYSIRLSKDIPTDDKGNWQLLADVIGRWYHSFGCCFVREVAAQDFNSTEPNKIGHLLKDGETQKPLDYFAARCIKTGEWRFCLKSRYDEDFDVAILDILYPGSVAVSKWDEIKRELDTLFADANRGHEITSYAKG